MGLVKIRYVNKKQKTLGLTIPAVEAKTLGIKAGDLIYFDWIQIKKDSDEALSYAHIPNSTELRSRGRKENDRRQERTGSNIPSRSSKIDSLEEYNPDTERTSGEPISDSHEVIQRQRRELAGNEQLPEEPRTSSDSSPTESIRIHGDGWKRQRRIRRI